MAWLCAAAACGVSPATGRTGAAPAAPATARTPRPSVAARRRLILDSIGYCDGPMMASRDGRFRTGLSQFQGSLSRLGEKILLPTTFPSGRQGRWRHRDAPAPLGRGTLS